MVLVSSWIRLWKSRGSQRVRKPASQWNAGLELLEDRILLYAASGNAWANPQVLTISFEPDGTNLGGATSNLFSTFNTKFGSAATWQAQILKAAQTWAQQTNINFAVVADDGSAVGSGSYQQGATNIGDIRIGGYNFGNTTLAQAYLPPPVNNYSVAGDISFNTSQTFNIGSTSDLYTVALHEFGHALGLYHGLSGTVMYGTYSGVKTALATDDISGIRNIYSANAARASDSYDVAASNGTASAASNISALINGTTKAAVVPNLDLTTTTDVDYYKFVVPAGSATTLKVVVQSQGLSLLAPKVDIYNSATATTPVATANGVKLHGTTITATLTGITAGATYWVKVSSTDSIPAFMTGKYAMVLNMGTGANPTVTLPNTQIANGTPLTSGGGQAISIAYDAPVNTYTTDVQTTTSHSAVAASAAGTYVATWASNGQDGSGWGVYAQLYDRNGTAQGAEFRVNTTTAGDQTNPAVAMTPAGSFEIAWQSNGQDGSGWGVYAQRYTASGVAQGSEFQVNATTAGDQLAPSIATDLAGDFVVTWQSNGQDGGGWGVYAQIYTSLGIAQGFEFRVNTATSGDQTAPSVVQNHLTGDFIVTWQSNLQDGSGWGIYAQRYNLLGLAQGSEFRVNTTTANDQTAPAIAINRFKGDFIVTWQSNGQDGSGWGIYAQRYNATGVAQGSAFKVNTTTLNDQTAPAIAIDAGGNSFITWTSTGQDGSGLGVFAQEFTASGQPLELEFAVNGTTAGDQKSPSIAIDHLGQADFVWSGSGATDASGVYSRRFNLVLDGLDAATVPAPQTPPQSTEHQHHRQHQHHQHEQHSLDSLFTNWS